MTDGPLLFWTYAIFVILLFITGSYYILVTRNLIRVLIGMEILSKGAILLITAAGSVTGNTGYSQSLSITFIVLEVFVIAIAAGIVLSVYRNTDSLDTENMENLKG